MAEHEPLDQERIAKILGSKIAGKVNTHGSMLAPGDLVAQVEKLKRQQSEAETEKKSEEAKGE